MNIKERITEAMKNAMRNQQKDRLAVIRLILAEFKQREVDARVEINDSLALEILAKMVKQRRDSIDQYKKASRDDLVKQEDFEIKIVNEFMPTPLTDDELKALVLDAITESGAKTMKDMGRVMNILKPKVIGRVDMSAVTNIIKGCLTK